MLNYNSYILLLEKKDNREKKIDKAKKKIRKFLKDETIIEWLVDKIVDSKPISPIPDGKYRRKGYLGTIIIKNREIVKC